LNEADINGDGKVTFDEFKQTMQAMIRKSWLRRGDRSPSKSPNKSISPMKSPEKLLLRMKCENSPLLN
jgi:hypothetical protein